MPAARVTMSGSPALRPRLDYVDGIRAAAALYVVMHHVWITIWPAYPDNTGPVGVGWLVYGHLAVSVFIVVSGFSLSIGPARRGWVLGSVRTFLQRRAWRILPTYWAALALSCLVFGVITPTVTGDLVSLKGFIVHALLLQDVINSPKPNGAFWSIAVEWQIYFLFPLILIGRRRLGPVWLSLLATVVIVSAYFGSVTVPALARISNVTPQFVLLFVFGVVAATSLRRHDSFNARLDRRILGFGALGGGLALVLICWTQGSVWVDRQYFWVDLLAGVTTAMTIAYLTYPGRSRVRSVLASPPLRGVGRISYSVYCVHLPMLWLLWHFFIADLSLEATSKFLLLVGAGLPFVLVTSWLFAQVFEMPFLRLRSWHDVLGALRGGTFLRAQVPQTDGVVTKRTGAEQVGRKRQG